MPDITPEYLSFTVAPKLLTVSGAFTAVALVIFLVRVYVRTVVLKVFGPDDWVMTAAVVSAVFASLCSVEN